MADVAQTVTASARYTAYSGIPAVDDQNNIYPRGRIDFRDQDVAITAKGAGDRKRILISCSLPANFAYTYENCYVALDDTIAADIDNYDDLGTAVLQEESGIDIQIGTLKSDGSHFFENFATAKTWELQNPFNEVFFNRVGNNPLFICYLYDSDGTNATSAITLTYHFTFLQYDIRQAEHVVVNAPFPVRVR